MVHNRRDWGRTTIRWFLGHLTISDDAAYGVAAEKMGKSYSSGSGICVKSKV